MLIDIESFALMEYAVGAGGDGFVAENSARTDDADMTLSAFPTMRRIFFRRGTKAVFVFPAIRRRITPTVFALFKKDTRA